MARAGSALKAVSPSSLRLALLPFALAVLMCTVASSAGAVRFVVTGRGYGHGVGMSQYGAQGYAQNGWTYDAILAHYYTGTALASGYPNSTVRVLVADGKTSLVLSSSSSFTLGGSARPAGSYTLTPKPGKVHVAGPGISADLASPVTAQPGSAALVLEGTAYRGSLRVASSPAGTRLAALNALGIEGYLRGVVPREMPASWEAQALRVQAVAARTYALATGGHCTWLGTKTVFCATTSDQVYGGKSAETTATNAAVASTAGRVVTSSGHPIVAYFSSTSGGRTAAKADEFGGAPVSYLVPVDDPYDTISPHHFWGPEDAEVDCPGTAPDCVFTGAQMQAALGLPAAATDLRVTARNSSTRVATLQAATSQGTAAFAGTAARLRLGLRSTWFAVGALSIHSARGTVTYGSSVVVSGLARSGGTRGWGTARLERKRYGETVWTPVGTVLPDGAWSSPRSPSVQTAFRVASGNAASGRILIRVRTRVTLSSAAPGSMRLTGTVAPHPTGTVVRLERRRSDGTWAFVASKTVGTRGGFAFTAAKAGTYRARSDAGAGLVEGAASAVVPG